MYNLLKANLGQRKHEKSIQEARLLMRGSRSYLFTYLQFETEVYFDAFQFPFSRMTSAVWDENFKGFGPYQGVKSCKTVFPCGHFLFTCSDTFAVGWIVLL